jgi:hypothetical protein
MLFSYVLLDIFTSAKITELSCLSIAFKKNVFPKNETHWTNEGMQLWLDEVNRILNEGHRKIIYSILPRITRICTKRFVKIRAIRGKIAGISIAKKSSKPK